MRLLIVALGMLSEAEARVKFPVSTTRRKARMAESWSIIKKPLLFEILDSVTNYRGLFQFIDNDNIWSCQFAASACPPKVGTGFGARICVRQPVHFRRFRSDR